MTLLLLRSAAAAPCCQKPGSYDLLLVRAVVDQIIWTRSSAPVDRDSHSLLRSGNFLSGVCNVVVGSKSREAARPIAAAADIASFILTAPDADDRPTVGVLVRNKGERRLRTRRQSGRKCKQPRQNFVHHGLTCLSLSNCPSQTVSLPSSYFNKRWRYLGYVSEILFSTF